MLLHPLQSIPPISRRSISVSERIHSIHLPISACQSHQHSCTSSPSSRYSPSGRRSQARSMSSCDRTQTCTRSRRLRAAWQARLQRRPRLQPTNAPFSSSTLTRMASALNTTRPRSSAAPRPKPTSRTRSCWCPSRPSPRPSAAPV